MTPAEQAVVDVALARGWIQPAALEALRANVAPGQLLPALRAHLPPAALDELRQVYEAAQRRGGTQAGLSDYAATLGGAHLQAHAAADYAATLGGSDLQAHAAADYAATHAGGRPFAGDDAATLAAADRESTLVPQGAGAAGVTRKDLRPGDAIGGYWIERELARGGMGVVYVARDPSGRAVALKLLQSELAGRELIERFAAEAEVTARLNHPNVVGVHASGEHHGRAWYAMELVEGESLGDRLEREGPLEPREAAAMIQVLAEALAHVHAREVLHRDLKPDNVLLAASDGRPILTDFGVARRSYAEERLTTTGEMVGTPSYMPPEQAAGELSRIGPASDLYALGATLYAALTGVPPFGAQQGLAVLKKVLTDDPPPPSSRREGIPRDLDAIVLTCLAKEPEQRYADAAALGDDLGRFLAGRGVIARVPGVRERLGRWIRRHKVAASVLGLGGAIGLLLGLAGAANEARKRYQLLATELELERETRAEATWTEATKLLDGAKRALKAIAWEQKGLQQQLDGHRPPPDLHDEEDEEERRREEKERDWSERAARYLERLEPWQRALATELAEVEAPQIPAELEPRRAEVLALGREIERALARARAETLGSLLLLEGKDQLAKLEQALAAVGAWAKLDPEAWEVARWRGELGLYRAAILVNRVDPRREAERGPLAQEAVQAAGAAREDLGVWRRAEAENPAASRLFSEACRAEVLAGLLGRGQLAPDLVDAPCDDAQRAILQARAAALLEGSERARAKAKAAAGSMKRHWWQEALTLQKFAERAYFDVADFKRALELCEDHSKVAGELMVDEIRPPGVDAAFETAGRALLRLGRAAEAQPHFKRWADMKRTAKTPEALPWVWLARCARLAGDVEGAQRLLGIASADLRQQEEDSDAREGGERLVAEWIALRRGESRPIPEQVRAAWEALPPTSRQRKGCFREGILRALVELRGNPQAQAQLERQAVVYLEQDP